MREHRHSARPGPFVAPLVPRPKTARMTATTAAMLTDSPHVDTVGPHTENSLPLTMAGWPTINRPLRR